MNNQDYLKWALTKDRTYADLGNRLQENHSQLKLIHAQMGLSGEVGELADAIKKHVLYNKPLDVENVKEEAGDVLWYMALLLDTVGSSFEEVMQINHDKLEKRFPGGFTEKLASDRLDKVKETEKSDFGGEDKKLKSVVVGQEVRLLDLPFDNLVVGQVYKVTKVNQDGTEFDVEGAHCAGNDTLGCHVDFWEKV